MGVFVVVGGLCCLTAGAGVKKTAKQMKGQERVLHTLDRFTFGPRPGDVTAVQAMGLRRWFEQQLNPKSIDDSALDARLATSPATAKLISTQLAMRFVSDTPPPALVDRMAKTFLASDGDIKAVLWTMFNSREFWSTKAYRAKVKTPIEFVVSAVRASGADVTDAQPLVSVSRDWRMYSMKRVPRESLSSSPWRWKGTWLGGLSARRTQSWQPNTSFISPSVNLRDASYWGCAQLLARPKSTSVLPQASTFF